MANSTIDFTRVTVAFHSMASAYGNSFIPASVTLNDQTRQAGFDLAIACGLTTEQAHALADVELIMIYMNARRSPLAAERKAKEIIAAHTPKPHVPGAPIPATPSAPASVDMEALKLLVEEQAKARLSIMAQSLATMQKTVEDLERRTPRSVEIKMPGKEAKIEFKTAHRDLPEILILAQARKNIMLVGPAGSGKSTVCEQVATALDLPFRMAASVQDPSELMGYKNIHGEYVPTPFREMYESGGVFLLDEMDRSDAQALCSFNAAFANPHCPFPDKLVPKHKDFIAIASANTFGSGANRTYIGATQLDGATLDRFGAYVFDYDPALEDAISPNKAWLKYVRAVRAEVERQGIEHIVSPRASKEGGETLLLGLSWQRVADLWLWKGLDLETRARVENAVPMREYEPSAEII